MKTEQEQSEIISELKNNYGTENYYKIPLSEMVYTDGINDLINKCKCYWLISDTAIYLSQNPNINKEFLILSIKVNENNTAEITLKEDSNEPNLYYKKIEYTDFALKEYEFYIINEVMLLKSEY